MATAVDESTEAIIAEKEDSLSGKEEELAIDESTADTDNARDGDNIPAVVTGKRQRTAVKAFTSAAPQKEKKELEFEAGSGVLLGDIDIVTEYMNKTVAEHYSVLHKILYNVIGTQAMRKKNIRRFNGFSFAEDSKEYLSRIAAIRRLKTAERKNALKLLGLKQNMSVEEMMEFLMSPTDSGKHAPSKKKSSTPAKRKRSSSKGELEDDKIKSKSKNGSRSKAKATPKKGKPSPVKSTPKKKPTAPKKKKKKSESEDEADSPLSDSVSDSDWEEKMPTPKKRKLSESITDISKDESFSGPSDEDLTSAIKKTVEVLDLEEVSMKQAVAKIHELFPDMDLSSRKSFIKEKIRELIG